MIKLKTVFKTPQVLLFVAMVLFSMGEAEGTNNFSGNDSEMTHHAVGNPYLPLWEHLPDGEPRVFEDPDKPGEYRYYIIGSHDVRFNSYCGPERKS